MSHRDIEIKRTGSNPHVAQTRKRSNPHVVARVSSRSLGERINPVIFILFTLSFIFARGCVFYIVPELESQLFLNETPKNVNNEVLLFSILYI